MLEGSAHPITGPVAAQSNTLPTAPAVFCSVQSHPPEDLEFLLQGTVRLTCIRMTGEKDSDVGVVLVRVLQRS